MGGELVELAVAQFCRRPVCCGAADRRGKRVYNRCSLEELGQTEDAQAIIREHGSKLRLRKVLAKRQRQLSMLTSRMKMIKQGGLPAETKRQRLDILQQRKNQLVKVVHDLLNR